MRFASKITPKVRRNAALVLLVLAAIAWPVTTLTIFAAEPVGILGLSWFAIILTCLDIVATADARESQDDES